MEKATKRQALILNEMEKIGYLSKEEADTATKEKLQFTGSHPHHQATIASYFFDTVKKELRTKAGIDDRIVELGGLKIYTTLHLSHQKIAEEVIAKTIAPSSNIQTGFRRNGSTNRLCNSACRRKRLQ